MAGMPSPIAHALAGVAAGWLCDPPRAPGRRLLGAHAGLFAAAGMAADLDLLVGAHSGPTHGLGAAVMAGIVVLVVGRSRRARGRQDIVAGRLAVAVAAAYGTHTLLDWLGTDSSPPIGIMALWPLNRGYFESGLHLFMAISRRYWLPEFWGHNLRALARELLVLLPVVGLIVWLRPRARPTGA